jgi:hypothetical protein
MEEEYDYEEECDGLFDIFYERESESWAGHGINSTESAWSSDGKSWSERATAGKRPSGSRTSRSCTTTTLGTWTPASSRGRRELRLSPLPKLLK